jgi:hypothetical protein
VKRDLSELPRNLALHKRGYTKIAREPFEQHAPHS